MNHMKTDRKKNEFSAPFDKDVILPSKETENTQDIFRNCVNSAHNLKKGVEECKVKPESSNIINRDRVIKPMVELLSLEKKPLECYFEGLKGKPPSRKKIRQPKKKCFILWDLESSSDAQNEGWISTLAKAPPKERATNTVEDRLQDRRMQAKIKNYEMMKQHKQHNISMKQRLAEENYLEQQENLAETWLGILNRQRELRNTASEDYLCQKPTYRGPPSKQRYNRIEISLLSKKFWSDGEEKLHRPSKRKAEGEEKKSAVPQRKSLLDNLSEDFGEQLVFIDTEDSGSDH